MYSSTNWLRKNFEAQMNLPTFESLAGGGGTGRGPLGHCGFWFFLHFSAILTKLTTPRFRSFFLTHLPQFQSAFPQLLTSYLSPFSQTLYLTNLQPNFVQTCLPKSYSSLPFYWSLLFCSFPAQNTITKVQTAVLQCLPIM